MALSTGRSICKKLVLVLGCCEGTPETSALPRGLRKPEVLGSCPDAPAASSLPRALRAAYAPPLISPAGPGGGSKGCSGGAWLACPGV